jgi:hypothetical protein
MLIRWIDEPISESIVPGIGVGGITNSDALVSRLRSSGGQSAWMLIIAVLV